MHPFNYHWVFVRVRVRNKSGIVQMNWDILYILLSNLSNHLILVFADCTEVMAAIIVHIPPVIVSDIHPVTVCDIVIPGPYVTYLVGTALPTSSCSTLVS